jgi:hypothetical protein
MAFIYRLSSTGPRQAACCCVWLYLAGGRFRYLRANDMRARFSPSVALSSGQSACQGNVFTLTVSKASATSSKTAPVSLFSSRFLLTLSRRRAGYNDMPCLGRDPNC